MLRDKKKSGVEGNDPAQWNVLSLRQRFLKRTFDIVLAAAGILISAPIIVAAFLVASIDTGNNGFFLQRRVGWRGRVFKTIKIRTMRNAPHIHTTVTASTDTRITTIGGFLRRTKIDELPQLINVFLGHMSFVGPRPDVPGYADRLKGEDRVILSVRPGITGPATIKYRDEENLLAKQDDPQKFNDEVIFPDKVRLNVEYVKCYGFIKDLIYIRKTILER
ncbi:MAG: O-antigen biosynthesis protein WlbG [Thermodesulfovibrionales bacterium]